MLYHRPSQLINLAIVVCLLGVVLLLTLLSNPYPSETDASIALDPIQKPIEYIKPYIVTIKNQKFYVKPQFQYEITGLVVARNRPRTQVISSINSVFNPVDICLVWGKNLNNNQYQLHQYSSDESTCFVEYADDHQNQLFPNQLSNNHLVTDKAYMAKKFKHIKVGDQIKIKGQLIGYAAIPKDMELTAANQANLPLQGNCTTRNNINCETINVEYLKILPKGLNWQHYLAILLLLIIVALWFIKDRIQKNIVFYQKEININKERTKMKQRQERYYRSQYKTIEQIEDDPNAEPLHKDIHLK